MVETGKMLQGFRGSSPRVCSFLLEKDGIMVWSPDTYSCGHYSIFITVWCWCRGSSDTGPKGPGVEYLRFTTREGGNRPCVGRALGGSQGIQPEAFPCGIGSSLAWPFVGNPIKQYEPCMVLVVEPIIHLWWHPTVWMVAIVSISAKCLCWLRFILYFRNVFYTMH